MGRPVGVRNKTRYTVTCKWVECQSEFEAERKGAMFCSTSCRERHYLRELMLKTCTPITCRLCGLPISYKQITTHFLKEHNVSIKGVK